MTQYCSYLHRHQIFRLAHVGPDKDLEMPVLTALIIPALSYVPAAAASGGESNRDTELSRQRGI
jgi:hypothetical protein